MATILCDLDGTLLVRTKDARPGETLPKRAAINRALADEFDLPEVDFLHGMVHGLTDWLIAENAVRSHRSDVTIDGPTWQRICARAEAVFDPQAAGSVPVYRALDGVPDTLAALRAAGYHLGIVTGNVSFFALFKLEQAGIDRGLFDGVVAFGDHGRERHHIVRAAVARAGGEPLVVLGDTEHDLAGARKAGLPFLGTGAVGLRRENVVGHVGCDWVADLRDSGVVVGAVGGLLGRG